MVMLPRIKTLTACRNARNVQVSKSMSCARVCVCACEVLPPSL
jgi:hypothetical protein